MANTMTITDDQLRTIIEQAAAKQQSGMMGFGQKVMEKAMSDPKAMKAGADMAGLMDDPTAMSMMKMGQQNAVPNGGRLGWTQALSNGIDQGIGLYNLLNAQKVKANALRAMGKPPSMGSADPRHEIDDIYGQ